MAARVLVVEDDPAVREMVISSLERNGLESVSASDAMQASELLQTRPPDLVLLDWMLPQVSGAEWARSLKRDEQTRDIPIIMLTARGEEEDRVRGFDCGVDDYVTKPFDAQELSARVQAVYERSKDPIPEAGDTYTFGEMTVDFTDQSATQNGEQVTFTDLEFDILTYFINHRGRTVSRKQLLRDVWGISGDITTRTIDRHVAALRKKIEPDPKEPTYIQTVYGIGYKFVDEQE